MHTFHLICWSYWNLWVSILLLTWQFTMKGKGWRREGDLPKWSLPFRFTIHIFAMNFSSHHACNIPCPSHPTWFDHPNNIWWLVQTMELLKMQIPPASCHFIPLWSKFSSQHPFSNILSLCSSLNVGDQVSHPYQTCKIAVLWILI
jgi:hypothetical protein